MKDELPYLTVRERVVLILVVFLVKMLKPWEYDHQFKEFWEEIKEASRYERKAN